MKQPKVLIGCPTCKDYRYILGSYLKAVSQIDYPEKELLLIDNSEDDEYLEFLTKIGVKAVKAEHRKNVSQMLSESRNLLREYAIKNGFDYLLSLEQDVIPKSSIINDLLKNKKDIVSAFYTVTTQLKIKDKIGNEKTVEIDLPMAYFSDGRDRIRQANASEILSKGLVEIGAAGLGCMLISRKAFEDISFRYEEGKPAFDDIFFCSDARKKGFKVFVDSSVVVEHMHKD